MRFPVIAVAAMAGMIIGTSASVAAPASGAAIRLIAEIGANAELVRCRAGQQERQVCKHYSTSDRKCHTVCGPTTHQ